MRVAVDDQIFCAQVHGGIPRYFTALMREFSANAGLGVDLVTPKLWTKNRSLIESGLGKPLRIPLGRQRPVLRLANRFKRYGDVDVVHHTYYYRNNLRRFGSARLRAITIHDMIPERFPELFPGGSPHRAKAEYVERADLIFCVSESTKRDLLELLGPVSAPIVVTPLGVDQHFAPGIAAPEGLPPAYILFVGSRDAYKDFAVLAEGFAGSDLPSDLWLVALGGGPLTDQEEALLVRLGIRHRVLQLDGDDRLLAGAYANSMCFVFPSRYEGFGLPTLEAMAGGCPVVLAESSSHLEVGGEAALFFTPGDAGALGEILEKLASDGALRQERRESGLAHAARFPWSETARRTAAAYDAALADAR